MVSADIPQVARRVPTLRDLWRRTQRRYTGQIRLRPLPRIAAVFSEARRRAQYLHHLIVRCSKPRHLNSEGTCSWALIARSRSRKCLPVLTPSCKIEDNMTHGSPTASLPRRAPRHIARAADWRSAWCVRDAAAAAGPPMRVCMRGVRCRVPRLP